MDIDHDLLPTNRDAAAHASTDSVQTRLVRLRGILREMGRVVVTFSGGVDSALLVAVAHEVLGEGALALTADSATLPPEEAEEARRLAAKLGVRHRVVDAAELEREGYAANAGDRCYHCKTELFDIAQRVAGEHGARWIVDGVITDDLGEHRPGLVAAGEREVRHPLVEAGFDKAAVRQAAHLLGLPQWDKPAFACLGSRFPVGTRVTEPRVRMVQRVESFLRTVGLRGFRARWHLLEERPMVRIEVDPDDISSLLAPGVREALVDVCKAEGFSWVTIDLQGYQRGILSHGPSGSATG